MLVQAAALTGEDAKNVPAIPPLPDPAGPDSVMLAFSFLAVLLLVPVEIRRVVLPDVVRYPPPGCDEAGRVLASEIHEDPVGDLGRVLSALSRVLREARMRRAAALRLHVDGDPAGIGEVAGEDVDAGHVAGERDRVASPAVDLRRDKHLPGTRDLLRIHLFSRLLLDGIPSTDPGRGRIRCRRTRSGRIRQPGRRDRAAAPQLPAGPGRTGVHRAAR